MLKQILLPGFLCLFLASACSRTVGGEWLLAAGDDTVSVSDVALMWSALPEHEREMFSETGAPAMEFLEALAGKAALDSLINSSTILEDPLVESFTRSWLRTESAIASRQLRVQLETAGVDSFDIGFYRENEGLLVWFTPEGEGQVGPVPITDAPRELARHLGGLEPGQSLQLPGFGVVRLDSLHHNMPHSGPSAEPDSVIAAYIGYGRERYQYLRAFHTIRNDPMTVVSPLIRGEAPGEPRPDQIVLSFSLGEWSFEEWERELAFFRHRVPFIDSSPRWVDMAVENLIMQSFHQNLLLMNDPVAAESLMREAEAQRRLIAAEILVQRRLEEAVTVTEADIQEQYLMLPEPVYHPERRVFHMASSSLEGLPGFRQAIASGELDGMRSEFPGVPGLAQDPDHPFITRPLARAEIPGGISVELYGIQGEDTLTWYGPYDIGSDRFAAFRLREVFPSIPATEEDLRDRLAESARFRLEALEMRNWLGELRERFGIRINTDLLRELSEDPGHWR